MFPQKRDRRWFVMVPLIWVTLVVLILTISSNLLNFTPGKFDLAISNALALVASVAICGLGYAGLKFASLSSALGVFFGIVYMSHVFISGDMELKGLVGLLSGAQLAFIFFMVGINGQMIAHLINNRRTAK